MATFWFFLLLQTFRTQFESASFEDLAGEADNAGDATEHGEVCSNVLVEPSIEEHVADGGAHGH